MVFIIFALLFQTHFHREYLENYTSKKAGIFLQKLEDLKDSKIIITIKCKILDVVYMQRKVVLVVSARTVDGKCGKYFSEKEFSISCQKLAKSV